MLFKGLTPLPPTLPDKCGLEVHGSTKGRVQETLGALQEAAWRLGALIYRLETTKQEDWRPLGMRPGGLRSAVGGGLASGNVKWH